MSISIAIIATFTSISTTIIAAYLAYKKSIKLQKKKLLEEYCTEYLMATYNYIYNHSVCDIYDKYLYDLTKLCLIAPNKIIKTIQDFDNNIIDSDLYQDLSDESQKASISEMYSKLVNDIRKELGYSGCIENIIRVRYS